jgi:hypothetical protein
VRGEDRQEESGTAEFHLDCRVTRRCGRPSYRERRELQGEVGGHLARDVNADMGVTCAWTSFSAWSGQCLRTRGRRCAAPGGAGRR